MSKPEKTLFLLDAMALIYRAHFAFSKNPRINSKGLNTGAPFGFTNSLYEIIDKRKPTHIGVAFDTSAPTFRHEEYSEYKANREETPEDIKIGTPIVKDIVRAFNIPVLELDGYEADDVIGTLAKKAARAGFEVFMMTPDKDYGQLVEEHVYLYKPAFMGNGVDIMGVQQVLDKWDIERIDQVVDMLGLQGDSVDNIPGIPGVGPKTASKLLKEYGSVEAIIENAASIKGKLGEKIAANADQGLLSKKLAKINTEVPVTFDEKELEYSGPNIEKLTTVFEDLEFRTTLKRILGESSPSASASPRPKKAASDQMALFGDAPALMEKDDTPMPEEKLNASNTKHNYHLIDTPELRKRLVKYLSAQKEFCFDTETDSLEPIEANMVGLAFSYVAGEAYYVPTPENREETQEILEEFRGVFENPEIGKIAQNAKYDVQVLKNYGIDVKGPIFDTMIAHYLIDPDTRHNMDVLAENYLNYTPISITDLIGKKGAKQGNMKDVPVHKVVEYAAEDADITLQLKNIFASQINEGRIQKLFDEVEMPLMHVLADIEYNGVKIDTDTLSNMSKELEEASAIAEKEIYELAGEEFNVASPKQLGVILFDKLKLVDKPKKTKTGQYATGEDILSKLAVEHDIAKRILEFREYQKLKSTYVDALPNMISPADGLVHTDYRQAVAATGRLSSNNPNLQNIPIRTEKGREIRKAFIPRSEEYTLMAADYSQIELRIVAAFAKDESMIEAFKSGRDIHSITASKVFGVPIEEVDRDMRRKAKEVNFGLIYGISAFGLSQNIGISRTEAQQIITAYFNEFPGVKQYMDAQVNNAREHTYVETILGRRRYLRDIHSKNMTVRGHAERNAINAPIQGSAADMIKIAMINIHSWMKEEKLKSKMIMQVHDELVFDVHNSELELMKSKVPELMSNAIDLDVPLEVEVGVGENWLIAH
ncbi:DNA polymerase I [Roseivirga spongicola]|uniref:DNA polymerase I n=2 Tax=Roseivirga TaxID=290180 RepID=A0A150XG59_9BACT|nr:MULTISPECIES: DNA polymerase I [Roseivirga]KYG77701.1 DNA polymerase I [Roseivirga spongicola]MBO6661493.1 DNA polymerase I [Roseivirga sp.]MBO6908523.1 DNA polymerase I [Roseivirga sp.]